MKGKFLLNKEIQNGSCFDLELMKDIENRKDLELLLSEFYKVVMKDAEIGHHFDDLDLKSHLPIIVDFWEKVLFGNPVYYGNPLVVHQILHDKYKLQSEHFDLWVEVFSGKVDENFAGENAENAKMRAKIVAQSLNQRLNKDPDSSGLVEISN